jgi:hypothetical protein
MANTKAVRFSAPKFMPVDGGSAHFADYVNVTAAALADTFDYLIPAGVEVSSVAFQSGALDTNGTPLLTFKAGYFPADSTSSLAAVDNYFAPTGTTSLRAGGRIPCSFEPISFNEDVILRITVTAAAATLAAGRLWSIVTGNCNGPQ